MSDYKKKNNHHHGDLRNALIQAGIEILHEEGIHALTLRKCAARADVSHAAPAYHFAGISGLLYAIAEHAFDIFAQTLIADLSDPKLNDLQRLQAAAHGYIKFGTQNPGLLKVIFLPHADAVTEIIPPLEEREAFQVFLAAARPFQPEGADPMVLIAQLWAHAHGYTALGLARQLPLPSEDGYDNIVKAINTGVAKLVGMHST